MHSDQGAGSERLTVLALAGVLAGFAILFGARRPDLTWLGSDLLAAPWNDVVADATRLPVKTGSVGAIVGLDFIHQREHIGIGGVNRSTVRALLNLVDNAMRAAGEDGTVSIVVRSDARQISRVVS